MTDRQKTLGILVYVDASPVILEDFSWLYKSWIYSGNWRTSDLVAFCHPDVVDRLPRDPGVMVIPKPPVSEPGSPWQDYKFINSIGGLLGHDAALAGYSHLLRTDADTFLTANLVNLRPDFHIFGRGRYVQNEEVRIKIAEFGARHGLTHRGVFNCGSSMLGPAASVLSFIYRQFEVCHLLIEEFREERGTWPGWCINTHTMYAAELVANHHFDEYLYNAFLNVLDFESYRDDDIAGGNIFHIHPFHSLMYWSKFVHREPGWPDAGYPNIDVATLDRTRVNSYCHWIAGTPVDQVKEAAGYPY
jgi:hypothetical protein